MTDILALVLDTLLPGGEGFPAARDLELGIWLRGRPAFAMAMEAILAALPTDFEERSPSERVAALQSVEAALPEVFGQLLVGAYSGYYVHPQVLQVIARRTGYAGRPPQPDGHSLEPFDPSLLDIMRRRPRSYRVA